MFNRIFKHKFISVDVNINKQKTNEIRKLMKKKFRLSINHSVYLEEFKQGNKTHIDDLFFLIQNKKNNISNTHPPSKSDHNKFCCDHPYRVWFLVYEDKKLYGSIYITNENSIGINFLDMKGKWNKEDHGWDSDQSDFFNDPQLQGRRVHPRGDGTAFTYTSWFNFTHGNAEQAWKHWN